MNTQTKWLFAILLFLLLFFAVSILHFYISQTKAETEDIHSSAEKSESTLTSYHIFKNDMGWYGMEDADKKIVIDPEWDRLYFIGENGVAAEREIGTERVIGVLDVEGNILVPFVYRDLSYVNNEMIAGSLLYDDMYFLYDRSFQMLTSCAWNAYILNDTILTLQRGTDTFNYEIGLQPAQLTQFDLQRTVQRQTVTMHCDKQETIQVLSIEEWIAFGDTMATFLKAYHRGEASDAAEILTADAQQAMQLILSEEDTVWRRLRWSIPISIYSQTNVLGTTIYCDIAVGQEWENTILQVAFEKQSTTGQLHITGVQILQD